MKHYVYLAGPITDLTYEGAVDWRDYVATQLDSKKVETLSPMRGKTYLLSERSLKAEGYSDQVMSTAKGINRRDFFDCNRADCVFVNLLGAKRVSIGTVMEIAWAFQNKIPTIVIMEKDNIHQHAMIEDSVSWKVESVEQALDIVKFLFNEKEEK